MNENHSFRSTLKRCLFFLTILFGMAIGGIIGLIGASFIMENRIYPYWVKSEIPIQNLEIEKILFVDNTDQYPSILSSDKLFIVTKLNEPYIYSMNQWQPILPLSSEEELKTITIGYEDHFIATTTNGKSFILKNDQWVPYEHEVMINFLYFSDDCASKWKSLPRIDRPIVSSSGITNPGHSHNFDVYSRCYILFEDGTIQLWSYYNSGANQLFILGVGGLLGAAFIGLISYFTFRRFFKFQ